MTENYILTMDFHNLKRTDLKETQTNIIQVIVNAYVRYAYNRRSLEKFTEKNEPNLILDRISISQEITWSVVSNEEVYFSLIFRVEQETISYLSRIG
jgi:hypothetical protein